MITFSDWYLLDLWLLCGHGNGNVIMVPTATESDNNNVTMAKFLFQCAVLPHTLLTDSWSLLQVSECAGPGVSKLISSFYLSRLICVENVTPIITKFSSLWDEKASAQNYGLVWPSINEASWFELIKEAWGGRGIPFLCNLAHFKGLKQICIDRGIFSPRNKRID